MEKLKERANKCIDQGECILKNKNKLCPYKKLFVFFNGCLKTFGSYLVCIEAYISSMHSRSGQAMKMFVSLNRGHPFVCAK
jgi:hypothetical protein